MKKLLILGAFLTMAAHADVTKNFVFQNDSKYSARMEFQICNADIMGSMCQPTKIMYIPAQHSTIDNPLKINGENSYVIVNAITVNNVKQGFNSIECRNSQINSIFMFKKIKQSQYISCVTGSY